MEFRYFHGVSILLGCVPAYPYGAEKRGVPVSLGRGGTKGNTSAARSRGCAVPRRVGWQSRRIFGVHVVGVLPYSFDVSLGAAPTRFLSGMVARLVIDDLWGLGDLIHVKHKTVSRRTCTVLIQRLHN